MKKNIFIIFFLILYTMLIAQEIPVYDLLEPIIIPIGSGEGEVGYNKYAGGGGGYAGPTFYAFSPNNYFYIFDYHNKRINVYNSLFVFIKSIIPDKEIAYDYFIWATIDEKDNLACILDMKGLYKLDKTGQIIFSIPIKSLPKTVQKNHNFFPIDENLLLYDDKAITEKFILLNNEGLKQAKEKIDLFIYEKTLLAKDLLKIKDGQEKDYELFLNENDLIFYNNKLITTDYKKHRKYFNFLKEIQNNSLDLEKVQDIKDEAIFKRIRSAYFEGFDSDGNSYWVCTDILDYKKAFIVVLSNQGELIDFFKTDLIRKAAIVVSPDGDVYFIKTNDEGCKIYKTIRQ